MNEITFAEIDSYERDIKERESELKSQRVQYLMDKIDELIEEFVALTGGENGKGAKHVKPRWRNIKKRVNEK